ncbi:S-adenosyl-L-methionine-dependent methyltransferase [Thamnocephalis sphaerospora]|uniref:tRNA (adenine(58)-N(1))-methyltransferase catalytic subunit TRM61 n=1 Tax=Thamnocephalis sphaerospora TaxID=78915 RepID=A0A4P9XKU2_9FUNG|nr:S-adenosyl-L-methionine-dependent methyltransferase [Thamnocephalis sphaerospora]|eukprot:RKP06382.1 S-adenosyl-L-methionine-dependent methyltransferase [Thamnocephalis sphaerospora]
MPFSFPVLRQPVLRALRTAPCLTLGSRRGQQALAAQAAVLPESSRQPDDPRSESAAVSDSVAAEETVAHSAFQYGDTVLMREARRGKRTITVPLRPGGRFESHRGSIMHDAIVGQLPRHQLMTHRNVPFTAHHPTLEDYVLHAPRHCTPIYPKDASAIVSLLDMHPGDRVLECGTGNGSLTMHLARAVSGGASGQVVTVEGRQSHATQAQRFVSRYRRGVLLPWIDFRAGMLEELLPGMAADSFDAVILDMPTPSSVLSEVQRVLCNDRTCLCYLPNMSQVINTVQAAGEIRMAVDRVVEVDWREWEVRGTQPAWLRRQNKQDRLRAEAVAEESTTCSNEASVDSSVADPQADAHNAADGNLWVCHPTHHPTGHTGFLLVLRKCISPPAQQNMECAVEKAPLVAEAQSDPSVTPTE